MPIEFILFGATLVGVALFHHHTLKIALGGLIAIAAYKLAFTGFEEGAGFAGLGAHLVHEWVMIANLLLLLTGFEALARHFEKSRVMDAAPRFMPDDWRGPLVLLAMVFVLSGVLDNIAAAILGATLARHVFKGEVHLTFLAAIVACANAGGAGSVLGDTTTTMMWIDGVSPLHVLPAYVGSAVAFLVIAPLAALTQQRHASMIGRSPDPIRIDWIRVLIAAACLLVALIVNLVVHLTAPHILNQLPLLGLAVWGTLLLAAGARAPDWAAIPHAALGAIFLLSLVLAASLMPVEALPAPSQWTTLGLGFVSAIFDNIPLTALALNQGGYDWALLAFAVGFGGSMIWFGSSAGVAVAGIYPQAKSALAWLKAGWLVPVGYVAGFFAMLAVFGWDPTAFEAH